MSARHREVRALVASFFFVIWPVQVVDYPHRYFMFSTLGLIVLWTFFIVLCTFFFLDLLVATALFINSTVCEQD